MGKLWAVVLAFLKKILGLPSLPAEVSARDVLISRWWNIYSAKAPWLPHAYVTSDGRRNQHTRRTLNPAKLACSEIAGLVLAEAPEVDAGEAVKALLERERFWGNLRRHLEYQVALGGMAIKVRPVKEGGANRLTVDFVPALNIIPLAADNSRVYEATFIDRRTDGQRSYVRTETYRRAPEGGYIVESRAFDETSSQQVPLATLWPGIEETVPLDIDEPPFVYFANPEANNIDLESPMGISAFHNAESICQALDVAYDEFCWEVEAGARRIAIPGTCMRGYTDLETGKKLLGFNPADRVFMRLEGDDAEKFKPTDLTGDIRAADFISVINYQLNLLSLAFGFDAGYFSFDGSGVKTATEVIAENSHTYKTREAYRDALDAGLRSLFRVINKLAALYKIEGASTAEPVIKWDDGIIEDRNSKAQYHILLVQNQLEDRVTAIKAIHGLGEPEAVAMADAAKKDKAIVADPFGLGQ